ncbi:Ubiquitin-like domain-containing CTD phosphatase 1 [Larimichthys crocea]|uniref:Uncharacterized protein n=1 Tax=Larimichthys crocea TaxID=215358 RepID=A0ACD3R4N8_LARCR|nr:Ubiquitin-like domain-containing CTD phosphatase 1 [Larimichthys crocea]
MDLKQSIKTLTGVLPERQKLLGLKVKGKPAEDEVKLGSLKLKPNTKIMMMGTREESLEEVLAPPPENDDVVNDFDIEEEVIEVENRLDLVLCLWLYRSKMKFMRGCVEIHISLVCVCREENLAKIARRVKDYKVEELNPPREGKRLLELGVTDNPNYKITFMLDSAAMITVHTPKRGVVEVGTHSSSEM